VRPSRSLILTGLVVLALVLRLGLLALSPHPYDDAGLATAEGNIAANIIAGRGLVENLSAEQAINAREQREQRLLDPADISPASLPAPHYQPEVLESPGEPILLAAIWELTGDQRYIYLQVLQALIDSLMVLLVYRIALLLLARPRAALLAAAGYAVFVPTAVLTRIPYEDIWAVFFTIAIVAAWTEGLDRARRWPWLMLIGLLTGVGSQFRPGVVLLAPLLALASWERARWRRSLAALAIPVAVAAALMSPWAVRNAVVFHRFIPTRSGIGQNLWEGLGEVHNDFGAVLNDQVTLVQVHHVRPDLSYGTPAYDSYLEHKALTAIRAHPGVFLHAVARRLVVTTVDLRTIGGPAGFLEPILFVLAVYVAIRTRRRYGRQSLMLAAVPVATTLPYLLLHVEGRYVLPASFVYLIWAGLGADLAYEHLLEEPAATAVQAPAAAPGPTSRALSADVALTLGAKLAVIVCQVAGMVLIARRLGPAGRGLVGVGLALLVLLQQLGSLGIPTANPYFALKDRARLGRILANSIVLAAVAGAALGGLTLVARLLVPQVMRGLSWLDVGLIATALPGALLFLYLQSMMLGEGRMRAYNLIEVNQNLLATMVLAVGLYALGIGVTGSIATLTCVYWLGALAFLVVLLRGVGIRVGRLDPALARRMFGYAARIYLAGFLAFAIVRIDLFLVNGYLGARQAGLYGVAGSLADGLFIIPMVVGVNVFPRVAAGSEVATSAAVFRLVALGYGALVLISAALAAPVIRLLYGPAFGPSAGLYYWLAPGVFSLGLVTVIQYHYAGRGFPLQAMSVWFVGLAVNLAIDFAFLPSGGTYVAALSSSVAYTLLLVLYLRLFAREVGGVRELVPRPREGIALARALMRRSLPVPSP
jgi:O-antigen/teichoic acid export membrane protein